MKRPLWIHRVAMVALSAVTILTVVWAGLITNWFRYYPSLEGTIALAPSAVATPVALLFLGIAARTRRRWGLIVGIGAFAIGAVASLIGHREAFGAYLPGLSRDHIESSGTAVLRTANGEVRYRLELQNPFSPWHREVLVVERGTRVDRIELPIFDVAPAAFAGTLEPADWIIMTSTPDENVFWVVAGRNLLVPKTFRVDLASGEAVVAAVPSKPAVR